MLMYKRSKTLFSSNKTYSHVIDKPKNEPKEPSFKCSNCPGKNAGLICGSPKKCNKGDIFCYKCINHHEDKCMKENGDEKY